MGGYGSGRWGDRKPDRKPIVENGLTFSVNRLVQEGVIRRNVCHQGFWEWRDDPEEEKPSSSVDFDVRTGDDSGMIRLKYRVTIVRAGEGRAVELMSFPIGLVTTRLPSNGLRWWFVCPAQRSERPDPCGRRVGKLYLPSGGRIFACRDCHNLTYRSCRESRHGLAMWNQMSPEIGVSAKVIKRTWERDGKEATRWKERFGQRAVFAETARTSAVPSTPTDAVQ